MPGWLPLLLLLVAAGCSSAVDTSLIGGTTSGDAPVCAPGQQITCGCPAGAMSVQVCNADGSGYAPCQCGTSSAMSGGMGGVGGMGGANGMGGASAAGGMGGGNSGGAGGGLNNSCVKQSDCGA